MGAGICPAASGALMGSLKMVAQPEVRTSATNPTAAHTARPHFGASSRPALDSANISPFRRIDHGADLASGAGFASADE
jgi:hypothetical protein